MARIRKDPKALREQAKRLLAQAEKLENDRAIKAGRHIIRLHESGYDGLDFDKLKSSIAKVIRGENP